MFGNHLCRLGTIDCLLAALTGACAPQSTEVDDHGDAIDSAFADGKADGACSSVGAVSEGLLALANDPSISMELLDAPIRDGGVGLDRRAAANIVAARPLADLEALDAVAYVGPVTCRALADYACNHEERCRTDVRAMTWNIRHFPQTPQTAPDVIEIVEHVRPALIGIQEIQDRDAFDEMLEGMPGYEGLVGEPGPHTSVGVLYDASVLEVTAVEDLFVDDWFAFPRPVLAVTAMVRGALHPEPWVFAVVHLKASPGQSNEARRRDAVGKLREWIDHVRSTGRERIVIVGDWNDRLTDARDDNVFAELQAEASETSFVTQAAEEAGEVTLIRFQSMVDHILVTDAVLDIAPEPQTEVLALDETWSADYIDRVSDHRPVMTTLAVPIGY